MTQPNPIRQSNLPGITVGDYGSAAPQPLHDGSNPLLARSVVERAPLVGVPGTDKSYAEYLTLYPQDFCAPGYVWNSGDDTPAMQACLDAAAAASTNVKIRCPPQVNLNSAPRHDRTGNAILALPPANSRTFYLTFQAAEGGTKFTTTVTGQSYSASWGPPSMIGGPTVEQTGIGINVQFSGARVLWQGEFSFSLDAPNATLCGLDMGGIQWSHTEHIEIRGGAPTQNTNIWQFGIRFPEGDNAGILDNTFLFISGCYAGFVHNAHLTARYIFCAFCYLAMGCTGNNQFSGNDGHGSAIHYLLTQECPYGIGGWAPTVGVESIPNPGGTGGNFVQLGIHYWDIEDFTSPAWVTPVAHVLDANNQLRGQANYARVVGNVGAAPGPLIVTGAQGFKVTDISMPPELSFTQLQRRTYGLAGHWRLGESSGAIAYDQTKTSDGSYNGTFTLGQNGALADGGRAVLLDGASGFVSVPDAVPLRITGDLTLMAWVNMTDRAAFYTVFEKLRSDGTAHVYLLQINNTGKILFDNTAGGVASVVIALATWTHIAIVRHGTTATAYINGVADPTTITCAASPLDGGGQPLRIGHGLVGSATWFKGAIQDAEVFSQALTAAQIAAIYDKGRRGL